jgi:hypothetical protein
MSEQLTTAQQSALEAGLRSLTRGAGEVARYCDRAEHAERTNRAQVSRAAHVLIREAAHLAQSLDLDLLDRYAARLSAIESVNVLQSHGDADGGEAARRARTWRELQEVQIAHDRVYHPDVFGLARIDQVRHCALHYTKLAASIASVLDGVDGARHDFETRRLPDMLLFGVKLMTLMGERLPDDPLDVLPSAEAITAPSASPGSPS